MHGARTPAWQAPSTSRRRSHPRGCYADFASPQDSATHARQFTKRAAEINSCTTNARRRAQRLRHVKEVSSRTKHVALPRDWLSRFRRPPAQRAPSSWFRSPRPTHLRPLPSSPDAWRPAAAPAALQHAISLGQRRCRTVLPRPAPRNGAAALWTARSELLRAASDCYRPAAAFLRHGHDRKAARSGWREQV